MKPEPEPPPDAALALQEAERSFARGDLKVARRTYERLRSRFAEDPSAAPLVLQAIYRRAQCDRELGSTKAWKAGLRETIETFDTKSEPFGGKSAEWAARAAYELAEAQIAAYEGIRIRGDQKTLARTLRTKVDAAQEISSALESVLRYRHPAWSLAARYRLGSVYDHLYQAITAVPMPAELSQVEDAIYFWEDAILDAAQPFEERALANYRQAHDISVSQGLDSQHAQLALRRLHELVPSEYPVATVAFGSAGNADADALFREWASDLSTCYKPEHTRRNGTLQIEVHLTFSQGKISDVRVTSTAAPEDLTKCAEGQFRRMAKFSARQKTQFSVADGARLYPVAFTPIE